MSIAITNTNAWEEVFSLFKKQVPELAHSNAADYKPALLKQDVNDPTRVFLAITSKNPDVVKGNITVSYERADLQKLLSTFADEVRNAEVSLNIAPGQKYKLSQYIEVVNHVLGTALVVKGSNELYDIVDTEFTAPAKGEFVDVALSVDALPADGSFAQLPLRVSNATSGHIRVMNRGLTIGQVAVQREINPFVNEDNTVNAGFEPTDVTKPILPSILLKLYNMDFTDVFGTVPLFNSRFQRVSSSNYIPARLTEDTVKLINEKFAREGIPLIPLNRDPKAIDICPCDNYAPPQLPDFSGNHEKQSTFFGVTSKPFKGMRNYWVPDFGDRGGVPPGHVNTTFKYFVRLSPLGAVVTQYSNMPSDYLKEHDKLPMNQRPLYLFFNDLI